MDLIKKINGSNGVQLITFDKLVFGPEKNNEGFVTTFFLPNNSLGRFVGFDTEIDKTPLPFFSLFPANCPMNEYAPAERDVLKVLISKNHQDITEMHQQYQNTDKSEEFWKYVKSNSYASDWFGNSDASNQRKEEIQYATEEITTTLLLTKYSTIPLFYKDNENRYNILGMVVMDILKKDAIQELNTMEEAMIKFLRKKMLQYYDTSITEASLVEAIKKL